MTERENKKPADLTECPICGSSRSVALRKGRFEATYNKVPIMLEDVESYFCASCEEEFFTQQQERTVSQRVNDAAREQLGVLSPERIIEIRKKLGLTQQDLEELLDLGDKVVTRWETGKVVPGRTTDFLLRLMERRPDLIDEFRALRREQKRAREAAQKPKRRAGRGSARSA